MRIAFVTRLERPELTPDDALAVGPCAVRGLEVVAAPWDDPRVDWTAFDAIVFRSCWDYHVRPRSFVRLLDSFRQAGMRAVNSTSVCRWNMRKTYLRFLQKRGVPVPPTRVLRKGSAPDTERSRELLGRTELVVKPVIGASGWNLFRLPGGDIAAEARLARLLRRRSMLVQPWLPEVAHAGEWSLVFFRGEYRDAARKRAVTGDFRVHEEYGGSVEAADPPPIVRQVAESAIHALPKALPYARVDVVESGSGPLVMELELIEPELFLRCHPDAPERFVTALACEISEADSAPPR